VLWRESYQIKQASAIAIAHGMGMAPMHFVAVSSSHRPWLGPKPLGAMVDTEHIK